MCKLFIFLVFSRVFYAVQALIYAFSSCFLVFPPQLHLLVIDFPDVFFAVRAFISSFSSCFLVFSTLCTRLLEGAHRPKKAPGAKTAPN